jgi:hypothetical protein
MKQESRPRRSCLVEDSAWPAAEIPHVHIRVRGPCFSARNSKATAPGRGITEARGNRVILVIPGMLPLRSIKVSAPAAPTATLALFPSLPEESGTARSSVEQLQQLYRSES